jgi:uncharacterized protein YndB with AHSA1/START domain
MRIRSDRRHTFAMPPEHLWAAIARVEDYRRWWPWLRHLDATGLEPGATWTATVQPPLPYRLTFELHLVAVQAPVLVAADVTGDIEGEARLELSPAAVGSELHLTSTLVPTNRVLRAVAQVAEPMARFGHQWVLDTGLRQFRAGVLGAGDGQHD